MDTKKCSRCGEIKNKDQFYKYKRSPDGLTYWCRECRNEHNLDYQKRRTQALSLFKDLIGLPDKRPLIETNVIRLIPAFNAYEKYALENPDMPYEHPIKYKLGSRPIKGGLVFKGDYIHILTKKGAMQKRIDLCTPDTLGILLANHGIEVMEEPSTARTTEESDN